MKSIRWLADASLDDTGSVVGKGANLGGVSAANRVRVAVRSSATNEDGADARGERQYAPRCTASARPTRAHGGDGPMKTLVIYESMYGNTRQIAEAIADTIEDACAVPVRAVDDGELSRAARVVVGGPTHAFGMSRPR